MMRASLCVGGFLALCYGLVAAGATVALAQDQSAAAPKDTIFARKILMDTIGHNMDELEEMARTGQPIDLADSREHADTISVMLMAFPHLFPQSTNQWRPSVERDPHATPLPRRMSGPTMPTSIGRPPQLRNWPIGRAGHSRKAISSHRWHLCELPATPATQPI